MKTLDQLPAHSKIWIYQANREITAPELTVIRKSADEFLQQWTSHENHMDAAIDVFYNRFIIIAANEQTAPASGCGIDKSYGFIRSLQNLTGLSLLERMNVGYLTGDKVSTCSIKEFEKLFQSGQVNENTIVFNNSITLKSELEAAWKVSFKKSWVFGRIVDAVSKQ